jgi:hypothetical protein
MLGDPARQRDMGPLARWYPTEISNACPPQQENRVFGVIDGHHKAVSPFLGLDYREIKEWAAILGGGRLRFSQPIRQHQIGIPLRRRRSRCFRLSGLHGLNRNNRDTHRQLSSWTRSTAGMQLARANAKYPPASRRAGCVPRSRRAIEPSRRRVRACQIRLAAPCRRQSPQTANNWFFFPNRTK